MTGAAILSDHGMISGRGRFFVKISDNSNLYSTCCRVERDGHFFFGDVLLASLAVNFNANLAALARSISLSLAHLMNGASGFRHLGYRTGSCGFIRSMATAID